MEFREFFELQNDIRYSDMDVADMYFQNPQMSVQEVSSRTKRSIGEIYKIIHKYGSPNRVKTNHRNVIMFADSGLSTNQIANLTGYTPRNVRYILKNHLTD